MATALPRFVVLKSVYNNKYLSLTNDEDKGLPVGFVKFDGEEVVSQRAKFELEMVKNSENKGLVHIRCSYNNKYLVWSPGSQYSMWIVAAAQKPEEDRSKSSCTLFEPIVVDHADADLRVQFRHVQLGRYASLWEGGPQLLAPGMFLGSESHNQELLDVFTVVDWETLVLFPRHVAFKGDNGMYLCAYSDGDPNQRFMGVQKDEKAEYEVFTTANGCVRIKSVHFGKFWRWASDFIRANESDNSSENTEVLFWPIKVNDNVVALRSMANNNFCKRFTPGSIQHCLQASDTSITVYSRLMVEELVISRTIDNLAHRLMDGRIYNESLITLATGEASNESRTEPRTYTIKLPYKDIKTSTWNPNVSFKSGVITTLKVSTVPRIVDGKIELSTADSSAGYQWGETNTTETDLEITYQVVVPPLTTTTVDLVATQGSCDVPFSYAQSDILYNGVPNIQLMDYGLYTATNYYHLKFTVKQQNL